MNINIKRKASCKVFVCCCCCFLGKQKLTCELKSQHKLSCVWPRTWTNKFRWFVFMIKSTILFVFRVKLGCFLSCTIWLIVQEYLHVRYFIQNWKPIICQELVKLMSQETICGSKKKKKKKLTHKKKRREKKIQSGFTGCQIGNQFCCEKNSVLLFVKWLMNSLWENDITFCALFTFMS